MKKFIAVALTSLGVRVVFALEATWVNENSNPAAMQTYAEPANWAERASGAAVDVAPTNAGDVAWFDGATNCWQCVILPVIQKSAGVNQMGIVKGSWHTRLWSSNADTKNGFVYYNYLFNDLSDFQGSLYPNRTGATFAFTGATPDVHVADLSVRLRPTVSAPAGTTVSIDARHEPGALVTAGSGTIKLAETAVGDSQIVYHKAGTLELTGHPAGIVSVPGDPALWVDAAKTNTMTIAEPDENGRRFITDWYDCRRGDGVHALCASYTPLAWSSDITRPWISDSDPLQNGHPTVNFGAMSNLKLVEGKYVVVPGEIEKYGPSASLCYDFGANAKEFFIVWRDAKDDGYEDVFFIGQKDGIYEFHRGENGKITKGDGRYGNGLLRLDGVAATRDTVVTCGRFHLLNAALLRDGLKPTTFFNDRVNTRIGGGRLAEAIFYTNTLTQVERAQVERYLQEKWFGMGTDAEVLQTKSASTPVIVPEGNVAKVNELVIGGAKLVKEGGGVLKVGRIQNASPVIDVAGGAVAFDENQVTVATDAPATNAIIWLDATADSLTTSLQDGTNFVTKWSDCRAGCSTYAYPMSDWNNPFVSSDTCNGLRVVDFGEKENAGTKAAMKFSFADTKIVEAFQVVKLPVKNSNQNIFGCSHQDLLRENTSTLLNGSYAYTAPGAGLWTMNGQTVDPYASYPIDPDTWYVASFSSEVSCGCGYLAYERGSKIGDQRIGEFIGYDRRLTDDERRQTIAYLMKKWRNETYEYAKAPAAIGTMNFTAANTAPTVVADADTKIGSVTFDGQTTFTKTGAGALTIDAALPSTVTDYAVEGDCTVKSPISPFPDAAFHVDASRLDTFAYADGHESDKWIDRWYDCRGNGKYAKCNFEYKRTDYATLGTTGADGEGGVLPNMPYVDFGTASGMYWYNADATQMKLHATREYHVVFMITGSGNHQAISGDIFPGDHSLCPSGDNWYMFYGGCTIAKAAAKKMDDGAWYTGNDWFETHKQLSTTTFYVQSFAATNTVQAYSFAIDRAQCGHGYVKLCEAIVFEDKTNTLERANAIHAYLMKKWKGLGTNPISVRLDRVDIAAGGTLSLTSGVPLSVSRLAGGGELKLPGCSLTGLESVAASLDATGAVTGMKVTGEVSFAPQVAVSVSVANPKALNGLYTIFSADSLTNADSVTFNLSVDNPGSRQFSLVREGSALKLQVMKGGTIFIFR